MKILDEILLIKLAEQAKTSSRKRTHYNFHPSLEDSTQRLCVVIEPGSYIRPHRHSNPAKWELFFALKGSALILIFDSSGKVINRQIISGTGPAHAAEIPENAWHTLTALESGTVLFEIKPGPYAPPSPDEFATWAPEEGTAEAQKIEA
ncbi:MAG: WbuC family cupin fold metalloprotein, partial [Proteobacteria bacterium]|nr:WbuC family cupin fold metalloprotein [Pseudomonadota bacterium]MBU1709934.1 WbuC family cupin fold metalloprotein [Pseudomonadota bacterium]